MELVLKLPKGKLPFIGIVLSYSDATKINEDLFINHKNKEYKIILEFVKKQLNIRLICEELVTVRFYNNIRYDSEKIKSWLYICGNGSSFNFGHVRRDVDKDSIVVDITGLKKYVLKVVGIKLIEQEQESDSLPF